MNEHLIELEKRALDLKNSNHLREAAELLLALIEEQPDWEHGTAHFNLASCYEDLGEFDLAKHYYREAIKLNPKNSYFVGAVASFLYLHGNPETAFEAFLELLKLEESRTDNSKVKSISESLKALALKGGIPREEVIRRINNIVPSYKD